jgi:hypothetical protein
MAVETHHIPILNDAAIGMIGRKRGALWQIR